MRIGLHHGQFVAGVIGSNQLRFDIWGEARAQASWLLDLVPRRMS